MKNLFGKFEHAPAALSFQCVECSLLCHIEKFNFLLKSDKSKLPYSHRLLLDIYYIVFLSMTKTVTIQRTQCAHTIKVKM